MALGLRPLTKNNFCEYTRIHIIHHNSDKFTKTETCHLLWQSTNEWVPKHGGGAGMNIKIRADAKTKRAKLPLCVFEMTWERSKCELKPTSGWLENSDRFGRTDVSSPWGPRCVGSGEEKYNMMEFVLLPPSWHQAHEREGRCCNCWHLLCWIYERYFVNLLMNRLWNHKYLFVVTATSWTPCLLFIIRTIHLFVLFERTFNF